MHPVEKAVRDLEAPISPVAADEGLDIAGTQLIKTAIQKQAAASAVELAIRNKVLGLKNGTTQNNILMHAAILKKAKRTRRPIAPADLKTGSQGIPEAANV